LLLAALCACDGQETEVSRSRHKDHTSSSLDRSKWTSLLDAINAQKTPTGMTKVLSKRSGIEAQLWSTMEDQLRENPVRKNTDLQLYLVPETHPAAIQDFINRRETGGESTQESGQQQDIVFFAQLTAGPTIVVESDKTTVWETQENLESYKVIVAEMKRVGLAKMSDELSGLSVELTGLRSRVAIGEVAVIDEGFDYVVIYMRAKVQTPLQDVGELSQIAETQTIIAADRDQLFTIRMEAHSTCSKELLYVCNEWMQGVRSLLQ
jgi:hypothetical protein